MKINFIQVHDYELEISKRLNETISLLPNDWICLTDQDVLRFPGFAPNLKTLLESGNINKNDLVGTMVNRLNRTNPAVVQDLFDESNIDVHFKYAAACWTSNGVDLLETKIIAGSCMIFHRSLWDKIGGFDESKTFFDKYFSYEVPRFGGRCVISKGLYVFHLYRWGSKSPRNAVEHLIKNTKKI